MDLRVAGAAHDVVGRDFVGVVQPGSLYQLLERMHGVAVKVGHACGLVGHHQRFLAQWVLCGDARGAVTGMAGLGLDAAQRQHETAPCIAPVGAQRHHAGNVKRRNHLGCGSELDAVAQVHADQRVVHQQQAFLQRHAYVVGEFDRGCTRAAFGSVHHDEVGRDVGFHHGLDHGKPFPGVAYAELDAHRFAARQAAQPAQKLHQLQWRMKRAVGAGADAVLPHGNATGGGNFRRDLGAQQHASVAGLGALAELELNHLDLRVTCVFDEAFFAERAVGVAAAKVAGGNLPDQVTAMLAVVFADRTFPRVVCKTAGACAQIQRQDGIGRECAKAHGRDVEDAGVVGLGTDLLARQWLAGLATNPDAKVLGAQLGGRERMVDPFIAIGRHIQQRAKRAAVWLALGALVDQRALGAGKGQGFMVAFDEVLAHLGAYVFEPETHVTNDRIVAQDGMARLLHIDPAQRAEGDGYRRQQPPPAAPGQRRRQPQHAGQHAQRPDGVADGEKSYARGRTSGHADNSCVTGTDLAHGLHCPTSAAHATGMHVPPFCTDCANVGVCVMQETAEFVHGPCAR